MSETRTINLAADLCEAAELRFGEHFGSVEQMLEAVLRELLREDVAKMDEHEHRIIAERLKALGYV